MGYESVIHLVDKINDGNIHKTKSIKTVNFNIRG